MGAYVQRLGPAVLLVVVAGGGASWAQEPTEDFDDPFRETSATESNEMLIRGAIRRMRKMEDNLQRPIAPEETSRLLRGLSSDQDEVVERLSRLALRLQEDNDGASISLPLGGGGESSGSSGGSQGQDQPRSSRPDGQQEGGQQERPEEGANGSQEQPQPGGEQPGGSQAGSDPSADPATDVYRPRFRRYFDPQREVPEADGGRWGFLPEEERQDLQREFEQPFHPQYRAQIVRYYRRVEELARADVERRREAGASAPAREELRETR